jgi:UDP-glucose 4-epimerase
MTRPSLALIGATGFIGRHLLDALAETPVRVLVHGEPPAWLAGLRHAELFPGDLRDPHTLDPVLHRADVVINLSGQVSEHIEDYQAVNLRGTLELAKACARHRVRRIVHASSALVYGDTLYAKEGDPCRPMTPYATLKLAAEEMFRGVLGTGAEVLCLRLSNVYGPNQMKGLMPYLMNCLRNRTRITIDADGAQVRDFVHVRDAAAAFVVAIQRGRGVINIGSGTPTSVIALLRMLEDLLDIPATGQYCPEHSGGERRSTVCVERAAEQLGWRATTALRDGLQEVAESLGMPIAAAAR